MRKSFQLLSCLALLALTVSLARAADEKVPLDKLPKVIVDAVKKRFPKAELVSADKETEDKKVIFEVVIKSEGSKIDINIAEDGTLLGFEKEVAVKDLPKIISDAVMAMYMKCTMKKAEEVVKVKAGKETLESYEVTIDTADKKDIAVYVLPDGKIKPEEKK